LVVDALPPVLLEAAAAFNAGRICLVIGAGTSIPYPTSLLAARATSIQAHGRLLRDGVLSAGDCARPEDLSALTQVVIEQTGSQIALISRMDPDKMRNAPSNAGHRCAAALMLEGIVRSVVTLNFDLSMGHALADIGARDRIATVRGPQDWQAARERSLIYIHRNIDCPWGELVLRPADLDAAWRDGWQQVVVIAALTAPVCLFAGLGSPATVLVESVKVIKTTLGAGEVFLATPGGRALNDFAIALDVEEDHYIDRGWIELMRDLERRVLAEHREMMLRSVGTVASANGWREPDIRPVCDRLEAAGLVELGRTRGRWIRQDADYLMVGDVSATELMAEIVQGLSLLEEVTGVSVELAPGGVAEIRRGATILGRVLLASGRGALNAEATAIAARKGAEAEIAATLVPAVTLTGGTFAPDRPSAPPTDILGKVDGPDIVAPRPELTIITFQELRANPEVVIAALEAAA
jgi:hypothetical protein